MYAVIFMFSGSRKEIRKPKGSSFTWIHWEYFFLYCFNFR